MESVRPRFDEASGAAHWLYDGSICATTVDPPGGVGTTLREERRRLARTPPGPAHSLLSRPSHADGAGGRRSSGFSARPDGERRGARSLSHVVWCDPLSADGTTQLAVHNALVASAARHPSSAFRHPPFSTVHRPPSTVHRPPSNDHRPPSTVHRPLSTIHRPPSTVHRPPSTVHRPPSTVHRPPSTVHRPPSTIRPPSTVHRPPSTVHRPPSTVHHPLFVHRPPSTVHRPPSTVHRPPSTVHRPPSTVHRPPSAARRPPPAARHPEMKLLVDRPWQKADPGWYGVGRAAADDLAEICHRGSHSWPDHKIVSARSSRILFIRRFYCIF